MQTIFGKAPRRANRQTCYWIAGGGLLLSGIMAAAAILGLRVNTSYSLPMGLYIISSAPDANLAEFCPDGVFSQLSAGRSYRTPGVCPDGAAPLLKPIVAREGDNVVFGPDGIRVNGQLLPNTAPLATDRLGRELRAWPFGAYPVEPGSIWTASSHNRNSFDSRYQGPIRLTQVRHRLKALWTLHG